MASGKQLSGGILHFASAGNQEEGTKITFPASLDWVRGVTAMNWDGLLILVSVLALAAFVFLRGSAG